jgi:hypothetical protein
MKHFDVIRGQIFTASFKATFLLIFNVKTGLQGQYILHFLVDRFHRAQFYRLPFHLAYITDGQFSSSVCDDVLLGGGVSLVDDGLEAVDGLTRGVHLDGGLSTVTRLLISRHFVTQPVYLLDG